MRTIYAGIALVAASVLLMEIALTRVFAIMLWHHLAYMVVSVAMLGFGAAGSFLAIRPHLAEKSDSEISSILSIFSATFGVTAVIALFLASHLQIEVIQFLSSPLNAFKLAALYGIVTIPFFFAGLAIGIAITRYSYDVGRVYFFDLSGSAIGGLASIFLLQSLGASATIVFAATLALLASLIFATRSIGSIRLWVGAVFAVFVIACGAFAGLFKPIGIDKIDWRIPYAPGKEINRLPPGSDEFRFPSATAEVGVSRDMLLPPILGGDWSKKHFKFTQGRFISQDGTAPTMLYKGGADLASFDTLDKTHVASAYVARAAAGNDASKVLVIGVGGGIDVMIALAHGASSVTAVEINSAMVDLVTEHFPDYIGGLFSPDGHPLADRIQLVHADGRSYVRRSDERFDVIQMSGVDSFTALSTGAYTLSESYLYTVEAIKDFYNHLTDAGYVSYSRFVLSHPRKPRESLRLANIAHVALGELGVDNPSRHLLVLQAHEWASILVSKAPFTHAEVDALQTFSDDLGFAGIVFNPLLNVSELPTLPPANPSDENRFAHIATSLNFHGALTGSSEDREKFVDAYRYNLSPTTDDAPFFFNYYRWSGLFRGPDADGADAGRHSDFLHSDFPVGHAVLLASLAQLVLFGGLLILLPLRSLPSGHSQLSVRGRVFIYFACLGLGFMWIEVALMQKMILFLGHPTYAVGVVLTVLLAAAGFGSSLVDKIQIRSRSGFARLAAAIVALSILLLLMLELVLPYALGLPFFVRASIAVALIAPLGILLGMPFPTGITVIGERWPRLVPWAWAINGFLSVSASISCIIVAMGIGFAKVWLLALVVYAVGFYAFSALAESPRQQPAGNH